MATFSTNPAATALDGSEVVPLTQGGVDKKTTAQDIANLAPGGAPSAEDVTYDNAVSGLTATDVQAAIDELVATPPAPDAEDVPYDNAGSGLAATDAQAAIDELAAEVDDKLGDAPSDGTGYVRKNGAWAAESGGGGGASLGVQYGADLGSTADSDPGAGLLKWNNATQASATVLFLDDSTSDGASLTGWWSALEAGGFCYLQHATDQNTWQIWEITAVTDATGYVKLGVSLLANGDAFADDDPMLVTLQQGVAGGGGGLTGFTSNVDTSTYFWSQLMASGAASKIGLALTPFGAGALMLDAPDGTTAGGNQRGDLAVDLQRERTNANQVASGYASFQSGGRNRSTGDYSTCLGALNFASGNYSVCIGNSNSATQTNAVAIGFGCVSDVVGGLATGNLSTTRSVPGISFSNGAFGVLGRSQGRWIQLTASTTSTTPRVMTTDAGGSAASDNQINLPNYGCYLVKGYVVATEITGDEAKGWEFIALVKRGSSAGTTAIIGTPTIDVIGASTNASLWDVTLAADTTRGGLNVFAVGDASRSLRWECMALLPEAVGS
jgi:hypothetical protein